MLLKFRLELIFIIALVATSIVINLFLLDRSKDNIYFDMWLNQILHKNEVGKLLENKDPELGFVTETKFKIDEGEFLDLKMIKANIEYKKKTKTLNVYLRAFNIKNGSDFKYSELPESTSKKICDNIMYLLGESTLLLNGKKVDASRGYIDYINFYFLFDINEMASGEPVGGITYKRSKEKGSFNFELLKSFNNADFS